MEAIQDTLGTIRGMGNRAPVSIRVVRAALSAMSSALRSPNSPISTSNGEKNQTLIADSHLHMAKTELARGGVGRSQKQGIIILGFSH
jgi:hypothetical protein